MPGSFPLCKVVCHHVEVWNFSSIGVLLNIWLLEINKISRFKKNVSQLDS
jgi:hypothetical protein